MSKADKAAADFIEACEKNGFSWSVRGSVVSISKSFTPGSKEEFCDLDMMSPGILDLCPLKGGSVWGTDGGGIGGMVALNSGRFTLNKSGNGKAFLAALSKRAVLV